jgi:hypothetical protein
VYNPNKIVPTDHYRNGNYENYKKKRRRCLITNGFQDSGWKSDMDKQSRVFGCGNKKKNN